MALFEKCNSRTPFYGGVPERPKGADCKSAVYDFGGSNPPPTTIFSINDLQLETSSSTIPFVV